MFHFHLLKERFSSVSLVASQIESRFIEEGDRCERFGTPTFKLFNKLSLHYNRWLNKQKFKDALLVIRGHHKLDNPSYYKDSVHLNHLGLDKYWSLIKICIINLFDKS